MPFLLIFTQAINKAGDYESEEYLQKKNPSQITHFFFLKNVRRGQWNDKKSKVSRHFFFFLKSDTSYNDNNTYHNYNDKCNSQMHPSSVCKHRKTMQK